MSRSCSAKKQIKDLALILNVSCPSLVADEVDTGQVLQLLEEWLKQSGKNALVAVLTDALEDCNLGTVISSCFDELEEDALPQASGTSESSRVCKFN